MRIIFFGTPDFAASILEHLVKSSHHEVIAVVSKPDSVKGRGLVLQPTPVKKVAQKLLPEVPLFQPEKASTPYFVECMQSFTTDVFLIVAYGEIIKRSLLDVPRLGCFNIHASLLPEYRGAAPIQRALMNGCRKSGITIFRLTLGMDSGDILWQRDCPVGPDMNAQELSDSLLEIAKHGVDDALFLLQTGEAKFISQHNEEATYAPKITPEDRLLNPAEELIVLHDHIRALSPFPGAFFLVRYHDEKLRLKVLKTHIDPSITERYRRWLVVSDGSLGLASPSGTLVIDRLQLEGRAIMDSKAFLRGVPLSSIMF